MGMCILIHFKNLLLYSSILVLYFFTACSVFLVYLDDIMRAFEEKRVSHLGLVFQWEDGDEYEK